MSTLTLNVNGQNHTVTVSSGDMPLLWVLRDLIGLTGTKYGCGIEVCGACTVLIDGQPEHSCVFDVSSAVGQEDRHHRGPFARSQPSGAAGVDRPAGAAVRLLPVGHADGGGRRDEGRAITASEIASEVKNLCVCGTYQRIKQAVSNL